MKAIGVVREVDSLGRVVIPIEVRRTMGMDVGAPVEFFVNDNALIIKKYTHSCAFTGRKDDLLKIDDHKYISKELAEQIIKVYEEEQKEG